MRTPARVTYYNAPPGLGHAKATLKTMAQLAQKGAHSYAIRSLATRITHAVPSKDPRGELAAIYVWVRDNIRYRFDPVGLEWVQAPARTLQEQAGDCDDMATLIASLAQALGHKTRFRTVGPTLRQQEHVHAQAWDGRTWVTLDPVLEKRQPTAAARPNDLGDFARTAPGAEHIYDDGGNMLGFVPNAAEKKLWIFTPWEDPGMMNRPYNPNLLYRSPNTTGGPPRAYITSYRGEIDESKIDGLGRVPYYDAQLGGWGWLKAIGKVAGALAPVASMIPGVGTAIGAGLSTASGVIKAVVPKGKAKALVPAGQAPAMAPGPNGFPVPAPQASPDLAPLLDSYAQLSQRAITEISNLARGAQTANTSAAVNAAKTAAQRNTAAKVVAAVSKAVAAQKKSQPPLKKAWDAKTKKWVFYRAAALSGIRPSFSINLLGGITPPTAQQRQLATTMVKALDDYIKKNRKPFYGKGVSVTAFQKGVRGLRVDGEYGPNVRKAARWALGVDEGYAMPRIDPRYAEYPVTWTPPSTADKPAPAAKKPTAAKPAPRPAPQAAIVKAAAAPVAKPQQTQPTAPLVQSARAAIAQVRAFIARDAKHRPPTIKLAAVRAFQNAIVNETIRAHPEYTPQQRADVEAMRPKIADALYGPQTRSSAATVLKVPESSLPPVAAVFLKTKTTPAATPKAAAKPAPKRPAAKKPAAAAPAAKTVTAAQAAPPKSKPKKHKPKAAPTQTVDLRTSPTAAAPAAAAPKKSEDNTIWILAALYYARKRRAAA